jgi:serine/threonine-protein kinase
VRLPRLGLLPRVVLGLAAVALLPLALAPFIIDLNRDAMTSQVLRTHAVAARSAAERVSAAIASVRGPAEAVARNPLTGSDPRGTAVRSLLAGVLQAQPSLAGVAVVTARGDEVIRVQSRSRAELVTQALAAVKDGPLAYVVTDAGGALRFEAPVDGQPDLRVRVVAEAGPLDTVMSPEELGQEADLLLSDGRGNVVAASRPGITLGSFPKELIDAGVAGRTSGSGRDASGQVLGAYAPVPGTGGDEGRAWFVLSRQPAAVAEAVARDVRRQLFLAVAAALCLAVAISALAWRFLVRPLREMARAQRRLAGFSSGAPRPGTEIGELRDALSMLERQIKDREAIGAVFVGRYQVVSFVGAGAMGSVFRGWDPKLQRPVALKTIRLDGEESATRESVSQLLHEAVTAARFSHPNIVAVYDVEDAPHAAFIALEFVDGTSLQRYLRARSLTPPQAMTMGLAIARGLAAAHAHGVVHRDVKPGNVLLGRDGSIKVTDFGIAGVVSTAAHAESVFGTPGYLPPEVLKGERYDERGDLFAAGVVLYESLTGLLPFPGRTSQEILASTLRREPTPLRPRVPGVPLEVENLVMNLLASAPAERAPHTAQDLARRLEAMIGAHEWSWSPEFADVDLEDDGVEPLRASLHPLGTYGAETPTVRRTGQPL